MYEKWEIIISNGLFVSFIINEFVKTRTKKNIIFMFLSSAKMFACLFLISIIQSSYFRVFWSIYKQYIFSVYLSIHPSISTPQISISLSEYLSIFLSIYLYIYLFLGSFYIVTSYLGWTMSIVHCANLHTITHITHLFWINRFSLCILYRFATVVFWNNSLYYTISYFYLP